MKQVLVTGGCGNIGANVVDLLVERGYAVRVVDLAREKEIRRLKGALSHDLGHAERDRVGPLGHRVVALTAPRMASADTFHRHPCATERAVLT